LDEAEGGFSDPHYDRVGFDGPASAVASPRSATGGRLGGFSAGFYDPSNLFDTWLGSPEAGSRLPPEKPREPSRPKTPRQSSESQASKEFIRFAREHMTDEAGAALLAALAQHHNVSLEPVSGWRVWLTLELELTRFR
jgi:hypothetical protein